MDVLIVPYNVHALAKIATDGILNSLLAGIALALLAWAVTRVFDRQGSTTRFAVWFSALVAIAILPCVVQFGASRGATLSSASRGVWTLPESFALYLFVAWIAGASFGLLRVALSLRRLRQLRSSATPVDLSQVSPTLRANLAEIQTHRRVTLCSSKTVRVPAAIGYFRPMVVFPDWTLAEIPPAELEAILLHELAHLRRWDDWTNLAQKIVKAILFFHPAVWFVERRLSIEREMACDDAVLASNFSPRAYAESLVGLAEKSFLRRGVQLAQAAVGHVQQLKTRIAEIMRKDRPGNGRIRIPVFVVMAVATSFSVYSVSRAPQLFAFSSEPPQIAASRSDYQPAPRAAVAEAQLVKASFADNRQPMSPTIRAATATRRPTAARRASTPPIAIAQKQLQQRFFEDEIAAPPMMVLSDFVPAQNSARPSAVLVVVQGEQFGINGPVFWRLTVFQLSPRQPHVTTGGIPRKT